MDKIIPLSFLCFLITLVCLAQAPDLTPDKFRLTGDAITSGENCFRLTPAKVWTGGTIWYSDAADLNHPFEMDLEMKFGCSDEGADGIVFILHPQLLTGQQGEGMGFGGLSPSFGIEMDTYQNHHLNDPYHDHVGFIKNGSVNHANGVGKPVPIFSDQHNIEDCQPHKVHLSWNPVFNNLRFSIDGELRLNINYNIVKNIFNNNPNVFWGFSSATGGMYNEHFVCLEKIRYEQVSQLDLKTISNIVEGKPSNLENVNFKGSTDEFSFEAIEELQKLAHLMQTYPNYRLYIDVHTDDSGSKESNYALSKKQGETMKAYLVKKGIKPKRIEVTGYGEDRPLVPNNSPEARAKNRRVEVAMQKERA